MTQHGLMPEAHTAQPLAQVRPLLVCPVCKGQLAFTTSLITCVACGEQFVQTSDEYCNLLPAALRQAEESHWGERQVEMEAWYRGLLADQAEAVYCFKHDYTPYAPLLATLSGRVLDVGGGNGIVRHYLPNVAHYISLDPSLDWLRADWASLAGAFPCLRTQPDFVRGVGEYLPFTPASFDAVLSCWSLNHASDPARVLGEVQRALKPGGRFVLILEDMEPAWRDINFLRVASQGGKYGWNAWWQKVQNRWRGRQWPIQPDHLRIREREIHQWSSPDFLVKRRQWIGQYLTYELIKQSMS